jgi:hypothetical protein
MLSKSQIREDGMIVITGAARVAEANRAEFEKVAERQVRLSREEAGHEFMDAARRLSETEPEITIRDVTVKEG